MMYTLLMVYVTSVTMTWRLIEQKIQTLKSLLIFVVYKHFWDIMFAYDVFVEISICSIHNNYICRRNPIFLGIKIKGFNFEPPADAVKQTETLVYSIT